MVVKTYSSINIIVEIKKAVEIAGSQKELAKQWGISEQYLSDLIRHKRRASNRILKNLGLKRAVVEDDDY